jgi:hypothetical protein
MPTANTTSTEQDVRKWFNTLPDILAGTQADVNYIAQGLQLRVGIVLLSKIRSDFITKSHGQRGEDGIQWKKLAPSTIARRRLGGADKKALSARIKSATLTQQRIYRSAYRGKLAELRLRGLTGDKAKRLADRHATKAVNDEGWGAGYPMQTRYQYLSTRQVDILRDTGELLASLQPGVEDQPSGADGQIFKLAPGKVTVGTNKKPWHHEGNSRLPSRPYWPLDGNLPDSWWDAMMKAYLRGLVQVLAEMAAAGRFT